MINTIFFAVVDKESGKFLKKSPSSSYSSFLTDNIGEARIFKSYKMADVGYDKKLSKNLEIKRFYAVMD